MTARLTHLGVLGIVGVSWGATMPLTKIAVSTGHGHFGLILWQMVVGAAIMSVIGLLRRKPLPLHRAALRTYLIIVFVGALVPNTLSYQAAVHLPAGIIAILISMVPIFAFPIALLLALDRFEWRRFTGLVFGFLAVALLILPKADLTGSLPLIWLLAVLVVTLCYGFEGNYVAKWGTGGCDPLEVLWGSTLLGVFLVLPITLASGQWIALDRVFGAPEWAQIGLSSISVLAYTGYVWLVGRAGPVFSVQVSYLVTLSGVFWAALLLGERYPPLVWASLALMLLGIALVQPRLAGPSTIAESDPQ